MVHIVDKLRGSIKVLYEKQINKKSFCYSSPKIKTYTWNLGEIFKQVYAKIQFLNHFSTFFEIQYHF